MKSNGQLKDWQLPPLEQARFLESWQEARRLYIQGWTLHAIAGHIKRPYEQVKKQATINRWALARRNADRAYSATVRKGLTPKRLIGKERLRRIRRAEQMIFQAQSALNKATALLKEAIEAPPKTVNGAMVSEIEVRPRTTAAPVVSSIPQPARRPDLEASLLD